MKVSKKAAQFTESVIREMTRLATKHGAVNLAQGFPDFPCPQELKIAAARAINEDYNQYSVTWGAPVLREAIAKKAKEYNKIEADPDRNIVVTCGTTEAMVSAQLAILDPGEELIVFDPHYENYAPDAIISGAKPKYFELDQENDFALNEELLKEAFNSKTRGLVLNSPLNPTGKVFTRQELHLIADLCDDYDAICFTDEIYEYILYGDSEHISIGSLPSMRDRTVTISGFSKTYSVTGWRVGYIIANAELINAIKKVHDFVTVGAPHPLQIACAEALSFPESYYVQLRKDYDEKRKMLLHSLQSLGFSCVDPAGAYYIWCDFSELDRKSDDLEFSRNLVEKVGVAVVPGSSFFYKSDHGNKKIRFTFSKKVETLEKACERLEKNLLKAKPAP
ncbi:MAG TPA: pyridoxal phosphate-dependent aminotransferase [Nitrososphaerales archaeon]|nr:pyridoxal phosphate-dependent aminotransferase [Nitrososphaerales archaeon]